MKQVFIALLLITIIGCSDNDEMNVANLPFVGSWSIITVVKDGSLQTEWSNTLLNIHQDNESGGTYQTENVPYDSVWSSNGIWSILDDNATFLIDDSLVVSYTVTGDTLHLIKDLPGTVIPCDEEPCVLAIGGQWNFIFTRPM